MSKFEVVALIVMWLFSLLLTVSIYATTTSIWRYYHEIKKVYKRDEERGKCRYLDESLEDKTICCNTGSDFYADEVDVFACDECKKFHKRKDK